MIIRLSEKALVYSTERCLLPKFNMYQLQEYSLNVNPTKFYFIQLYCVRVLYVTLLCIVTGHGKTNAMKTADVSYLELPIGVALCFLAPTGVGLPTLRILRGYIYMQSGIERIESKICKLSHKSISVLLHTLASLLCSSFI